MCASASASPQLCFPAVTVLTDRVKRKFLFALALAQTLNHLEGQSTEGGEKDGEEGKRVLSISRAKENKAHQRSQIPIGGYFRTS